MQNMQNMGGSKFICKICSSMLSPVCCWSTPALVVQAGGPLLRSRCSGPGSDCDSHVLAVLPDKQAVVPDKEEHSFFEFPVGEWEPFLCRVSVEFRRVSCDSEPDKGDGCSVIRGVGVWSVWRVVHSSTYAKVTCTVRRCCSVPAEFIRKRLDLLKPRIRTESFHAVFSAQKVTKQVRNGPIRRPCTRNMRYI